MLSRRNAVKEAELQEALAAESDASGFDADMQLPADSFDSHEDDLDVGEADAPVSEERVTAQTGDALGEADIYIAYGRFNQAADLLHNAINNEPQRSDLRLKLMEVYAELGDREGIARQESELHEIGGAAVEVEQLKTKYPAMAAFAVAGMSAAAAAVADDDLDSFNLDDLTLDEPSQPAAETDGLDEAFDLSLDELESEQDHDQQAAAGDTSLADIDTLDLESDLDLNAPAEMKAGQADDLSFDLSLDDASGDGLELGDELVDFSLSLDDESKPAAEEDGEDEFLLSLDDEVPAAAQPGDGLTEAGLDLPGAAAESEFDFSADFDLSLGDEIVAEPAADSFAAQLDEVTEELDQLANNLDQPPAASEPSDVLSADAPQAVEMESDDDFDFLSGTDETATKLDLARAYIDMGDTEGARDILDEVIVEGNEDQQQEARELVTNLV
jgi:pilus assembly protein FimV